MDGNGTGAPCVDGGATGATGVATVAGAGTGTECRTGGTAGSVGVDAVGDGTGTDEGAPGCTPVAGIPGIGVADAPVPAGGTGTAGPAGPDVLCGCVPAPNGVPQFVQKAVLSATEVPQRVHRLMFRFLPRYW